MFSQNLVPNGNFDIQKSKEDKTPDLWESDFLSASYFIKSHPGAFCYHDFGKLRDGHICSITPPLSGDCFMGFYVYGASDRRGYWGNKLLRTLEKDKSYKIEMFILTPDVSDIYIKGFQMLFTSGKPECIGTNISISGEKFKKYNDNKQFIFLSKADSSWINRETSDWIKITGEYKANGTENYITIGNFKDNITTIKVADYKSEIKRNISYICMDNVSITEISEFNTNDIKVNRQIELENIFFETGKADLLNSSYKEIDKLFRLLNINPTIIIELAGYTDNTGKEESNKILSYNRAKAVAEYLISKGISENRLKYNGYGSSSPKYNNNTEQGKTGNRRVEFKILAI